MTEQFAGRPFKPRLVAESELRRYVFEYDARASILPKDLDPVDVTEFARQQWRLPTLGPGPANHLIEVEDFYDTAAVVPDMLALLQRREDGPEKFLIAVALTRGVGILGSGADRDRGLEYLLYLLGLPYVPANAEAVLAAYNEYSLLGRSEPVAGALAKLQDDLSRQSGTDPVAETRMREVEDLANNMLPRIVHAADHKRAILAVADLPARLDALVDIYLALDTRYREWTLRWATRLLLREARAGRTAEVVAAFRRGLTRLPAAADSKEALSALRATSLRAVEFFGGQLSEAERVESRSIPTIVAGMLTLD